MDKFKKELIYDYADNFINLANEMAYSDHTGAVGVAFRYAAARYCAYEASLLTNNLAADKEKHLQLIVKAFTDFLQIHLEDYIELQSQQKDTF